MTLLLALLQAQPTPEPWPVPLWAEPARLTLLSVGRAIATLVITMVIARYVRVWFDHATQRTRADASSRLLVGRLLSLGIITLGIFTVLESLGVPPAAVITFLGAIGLALSLSTQEILKNFFSGLYLLFERPFRIGDEIVVKDHRGRVEHIGIRTTKLRTEDNVQVLIPNASLFTEIVFNRSEFRPRPVEEPDETSTTDPPSSSASSSAG
ncbi:MAG: mechanosensitive ion channel [Chloroflexi bacterium]|nr:mechanosensitive ion channel [Chloroflexota bacterium]